MYEHLFYMYIEWKSIGIWFMFCYFSFPFFHLAYIRYNFCSFFEAFFKLFLKSFHTIRNSKNIYNIYIFEILRKSISKLYLEIFYRGEYKPYFCYDIEWEAHIYTYNRSFWIIFCDISTYSTISKTHLKKYLSRFESCKSMNSWKIIFSRRDKRCYRESCESKRYKDNKKEYFKKIHMRKNDEINDWECVKYLDYSIAIVRVSSSKFPLLKPTFKSTLKLQVFLYACVGFASVEFVPSPKSQ